MHALSLQREFISVLTSLIWVHQLHLTFKFVRKLLDTIQLVVHVGAQDLIHSPVGDELSGKFV